MSRPVFLINHDFNDHILRGVLRREPLIKFVKARDVGLDQSDDNAILDYAAKKQMIVLSHDVNTMSAAAYSRIENSDPMNGLLLVHQKTALAPIIDDIILIWSSSEGEEWVNEVRFLPL